MTPHAQIVVTTRTREGRHVSRILPRAEADQLLNTLHHATRNPTTTDPIRFETFMVGGEILLTGDAILAAELIPTATTPRTPPRPRSNQQPRSTNSATRKTPGKRRP